MRIRNNQIARKTEEIVKRYLFDGTYPKLKSITNELSVWMQEHVPGTPLFKSRKVFKKEQTNSTDFNHAMQAIEEDIRDIYDASIYQQNQLMQNFTNGEIMRERLRHDLDEINNQLDKYIAMSQYADSYVKFEEIISLENVNQLDINLTDADIDIRNRQVTLRERVNQSKRIVVEPNNVKVNVRQSHISINNIEPTKYAFDDSVNTAWWCKVTTRDMNAQNNMEVEITIPFSNEVIINTFDFTPHHTKEMYISLEYSQDNVTYSPIPNVTNIKVQETTKWSFKDTKMKYLKLVIRKPNFDEIEGKIYVYYFGAKNIAIYKKSYEEESYLYSTVLKVPATSKQLSLSANGIKNANTDVEFAVCFNPSEPENDWIWQEIDDANNTSNGKAKTIEINNMEKISVSGRKVIETGEVFNGVRAYKIVKSDGSAIFTPDDDSVSSFSNFLNAKLYRGIQQWKREQTYKQFIGDVPTNADWNDLYENKGSLITTDFFIKTNALPLKDVQHNFYRYTTCIYSNAKRQLPLYIELTGITNKEIKKRLGSFSVYCNQQRLIPVNDEVTLNLTTGWNEIQILVHLGDVTHRKDLEVEEIPSSFLLGKFNIVAENYVRAELNPMKQIEKESLFYNVSPMNHEYFAIDNQQVILNYLPEDTIFELVYDNKDLSNNTIDYIVRAKLKRTSDDESATPIIKKIRVRTV